MAGQLKLDEVALSAEESSSQWLVTREPLPSQGLIDASAQWKITREKWIFFVSLAVYIVLVLTTTSVALGVYQKLLEVSVPPDFVDWSKTALTAALGGLGGLLIGGRHSR